MHWILLVFLTVADGGERPFVVQTEPLSLNQCQRAAMLYTPEWIESHPYGEFTGKTVCVTERDVQSVLNKYGREV